MKRIKVISATSKTDEKDTLLFKSIFQYKDHSCRITANIKTQNIESLAKVYNKAINNPDNRDTILVFTHDDFLIEDLFLQEKLHKAMEDVHIVGLAGVKAPIQIKQPCLWHLMAPPSQYSGAVGHFEKDNTEKRFMTAFGKTPERVILLDGVFIAINTEEILKKGLRFDENNPAKFHFYDLNFCLDANKLGLKCGTYPIWGTHRSHGLEQVTQDWIEGQNYFIAKY